MTATANNKEKFDLLSGLQAETAAAYNKLSKEELLRSYQQSLMLVLIQAISDLFPRERVRIAYSINESYYAELVDSILSPREAEAIERRMRQIIMQERPIRRVDSQPADILKKYSCGDVIAGFMEILLPNTGLLKLFKLHYYQPGFVVQYPGRKRFDVLTEYVEPVKLSKTMAERRAWLRNLQLTSVEAVNKTIEDGSVTDLIYLSEALYEKKVAGIADIITGSLPKRRLVFISGPSSSGKTTFVQRLSTQLRVNGLKLLTLSLDDYYLPLEKCPRDEKGEYDFETIEALDLELFNRQLNQLLNGEKICLPLLDFKSGERNKWGKEVQINDDYIILIEGIHGLNERLLQKVSNESVFRIYISALAQLNINDYNRVHTSDVRLVRRIVRDSQFRSSDAEMVLSRWAAVRQGETKYIFPYQEQADVMFDSSLIYELNALRPRVEPLLQAIAPDSPYRRTAVQLLNTLSFFKPLNGKVIPFNSVLREFMGGSYLQQD